MHKVFAQMGNVLEENGFVAEGDVVEQSKMLVKLPHVADVRYNGYVESAAKQTDGEEFAHSRNPHGIGLKKTGAFGLQIVFKNHAVRDVFAEREFGRRNGIRERLVAQHIVGMGRFLDPEWIDVAQPLANVQGLRQGPLLVGIHHHARLVPGGFADNPGAPQIAVRVAGADF
jgi:hypothetical protein